MERKLKLGEMLVRANLITDLQLGSALQEQQKWGGKLGKLLVDMKYVSEDMLIKALSHQMNLQRANLETLAVPPQVLAKVDQRFCEENMLVPCAYSHTDKALQVAMFDPTNLRALDDIKLRTGLRILPALAGQNAILAAIARLFSAQSLRDDGPEDFQLTGNSGADVGARIQSNPQAPRPQSQPPMQAPVQEDAANVHASPAVRAAFDELGKMQQRHTRAVKALMELLIEKGAFSQEEFMGWLNRRRS